MPEYRALVYLVVQSTRAIYFQPKRAPLARSFQPVLFLKDSVGFELEETAAGWRVPSFGWTFRSRNWPTGALRSRNMACHQAGPMCSGSGLSLPVTIRQVSLNCARSHAFRREGRRRIPASLSKRRLVVREPNQLVARRSRFLGRS